MKSAVAVTLAVLAGSAVAQISLTGLPTCAQSCLNAAGLSSSGCSSLNIDCICTNKSFVNGLSCCVSQKCDAADTQATIEFANGICKQASVTLPTAAGCTASGASSAASSAASGSSSAASVASTTATVAVGSVTTTATASGSASSASSAASGSTTGSGSGMMSMTTSASGSASAASVAPSSSTGGAAAFGQCAGAAGGLVAALVALL